MMNSKTAKLISPERVVELLDSYGADPQAWPDDERTTALALIQHSTDLKSRQREARQLDSFLAGGEGQLSATEPVDRNLVSRILDNLPAQHAAGTDARRRQVGTCSRATCHVSNWIGMVAASVAVFIITVSIIELYPTPVVQSQSSVSQAELDYWMWQQVAGEPENDDEEPLTMMALFEPE